MSYEQKYLKYKIKYLDLMNKNKIPYSNLINKTGGGMEEVYKFNDIDGVNIIFCDFDRSFSSTDISKPEFYKRFGISETNKIALINGVNKTFSPDQGGTNAAITAINIEFFNQRKCNSEPIYDSSKDVAALSKEKYYTFITSNVTYNKQLLTFNKKEYNIGTVIYCPEQTNKITKKDDLDGVYHINGINLQTAPEIDRKPIENIIYKNVYNYYTNILNDFLIRGTGNTIHLPPVPGGIYKGSDIIKHAMFDAIYNFCISTYKQQRILILILAFKRSDLNTDKLNRIEKYTKQLKMEKIQLNDIIASILSSLQYSDAAAARPVAFSDLSAQAAAVSDLSAQASAQPAAFSPELFPSVNALSKPIPIAADRDYIPEIDDETIIAREEEEIHAKVVAEVERRRRIAKGIATSKDRGTQIDEFTDGGLIHNEVEGRSTESRTKENSLRILNEQEEFNIIEAERKARLKAEVEKILREQNEERAREKAAMDTLLAEYKERQKEKSRASEADKRGASEADKRRALEEESEADKRRVLKAEADKIRALEAEERRALEVDKIRASEADKRRASEEEKEEEKSEEFLTTPPKTTVAERAKGVFIKKRLLKPDLTTPKIEDLRLDKTPLKPDDKYIEFINSDIKSSNFSEFIGYIKKDLKKIKDLKLDQIKFDKFIEQPKKDKVNELVKNIQKNIMDNSPILQVGGEPTIDFKKITFKNIDILIKRLQNLDKIIKVILILYPSPKLDLDQKLGFRELSAYVITNGYKILTDSPSI